MIFKVVTLSFRLKNKYFFQIEIFTASYYFVHISFTGDKTYTVKMLHHLLQKFPELRLSSKIIDNSSEIVADYSGIF